VIAGSRLLDNSSIYDPYWSVLPIGLALWHLHDAPADGSAARQTLVLALARQLLRHPPVPHRADLARRSSSRPSPTSSCARFACCGVADHPHRPPAAERRAACQFTPGLLKSPP